MTDSGMEAPVDDAIEQHQSIREDEDAGTGEWAGEMPLDANEADRAEQDRTVELDEDDYR